jgi:hypothetical protein
MRGFSQGWDSGAGDGVRDGAFPEHRAGSACENEKCGLKDVVGVGGLAKLASSQAVNHRRVTANDRRECFAVLLAGVSSAGVLPDRQRGHERCKYTDIRLQ